MSKRKQKVGINGVSLAKKNKCLDGTYVDHKKYTKLYRYKTMKVIKDIRAGIVNELDMDRLQNFIQFSLALMDQCSMETIDKAWRNAEAMSFIHAELGIEVVEPEAEDYAGILDPQVQREALIEEVTEHAPD